MGDFCRLPGLGCVYYARGRCLYEEELNPGYNQALRCKVLLHWEAAYDDFLCRVDAFALDQDAVPDLWRRRFERLVQEQYGCDDFEHAPGAGPPACAFVMDGLCLLRLPRCEGRCRRFKPVATGDFFDF